MNKAFTMIEMLLATMLVGVLTTLSILTFRAVTRGWQVSTDYMDKMQRTDYALNQIMSGLRSMYYPHDGKQDEGYGFSLVDNGDGERPKESDVIEWSKTGSAIVGNKSAVADTVHRVQVMILEEGDSDYREPVQKTGLYARLCGDAALRPKDDEADSPDKGYGFDNDELYQPVLIADGVVGFNCRVLKKAEEAEGSVRNSSENDRRSFEDEFSESNSVPYKVELTFYLADRDGRSYRTDTAPVVRIVRIPIHEQSLDGAKVPSDGEKEAAGGGALR
ncbi:MAG: type II secretion system protein [Kiritimatiellae bacterium]|nr:type II secretion system protein [Kiritimatiellia bacterium]